MGTRIDDTPKGCTMQWKLENISHCWAKNSLDSSSFTADALRGTRWYLRFVPFHPSCHQENISFYLQRDERCEGPEFITVNFDIAVLDKDGSYLQERTLMDCLYLKKGSWGFELYETREKVFVTQREAFLPNDTLTVQCTIYVSDQKPANTERFYDRTVFSVNRRSFTCRIDEFSFLKCDKILAFKDSLIDFYVVLEEGLEFGRKLVINVHSFDKNLKYFLFKASIVDSGGKKENCCTQEYFEGDLTRGVLCNLLFQKWLIGNRRRYLPNDVLTLDCEYVCSDGTISYSCCGCGIITPKSMNELQTAERRNEYCIEKDEFENTTVIEKDFTSNYNDQIVSDIEIRTSTKTFQARKNILSVRSNVFRKMLSPDTKEQFSGHIEIEGFEDHIVHRMLVYMHTDILDYFQYEDLFKLYMAAYKYEILSLRYKCAYFIKMNLYPDKVCDVLSLADRHEDDGLISDVFFFILRHYKEVFRSQKWKDFMNANNKLATDILYRFSLSKI